MYPGKRLIFVMSIVLILVTMIALTCYGSSKVKLTCVGGSVGGVWSIYTEGVSEVMRMGNPDYIINAEPGSTSANPGVVNDNKAQLGLAFGLTSYQAYKGMEPYKQECKNLRAVAALIPKNVFQFVVSKKSNINSFEQVKNDEIPFKISVDSKGSPGDVVTEKVLNSYGITYKSIEKNGGKIFYLPGSKTFEMMGDGRMDGTGDCLPIPSGDILQASVTIDLKMLPLSEDVIKQVCEELGMSKGIVPSGTYNFLKKDIPSVNMPVILLTNIEQSEEVIYNLTKSLYENKEYLKNVAKGFADLNDKTIIEVNDVPFHPGAEKYFKEIGLLK